MTKKKSLGIWMDHSTAHLMEFTSNIKTHVFSNTFDHQEKVVTLKRSERKMHNKEQQEHAFVKEYFTQKNKTEYKNYIMDHKKEIEKAKAHIVVALIEYIPNAVVSKTIIKKTTGNITATSFDIGEELGEKTLPFDTYVQIIDGTAEVVINDKQLQLSLGEGIIIPAHAKHSFNANEQFKMLTTVIKSGYEDLN